MINKPILTFVYRYSKALRENPLFSLALLFVLLCLTGTAYADVIESYSYDRYLEFCSKEVFDKKYSDGGCWSCAVINTVMRSMVSVIGAITTPMIELSKLILSLGGAIWLAIYFMKSLSSFAMQDPAKVIDGVVVFMFKWALVYTLIAAGIGEIVAQIVNPLLSIGMDIGQTFASQAGI